MSARYSPTRRDAYRVNRAQERTRTVQRAQERATKRFTNSTNNTEKS